MALLGIYPTVARSPREGARYVAGFLLGAALAIPVGMFSAAVADPSSGLRSWPRHNRELTTAAEQARGCFPAGARPRAEGAPA